MGSKTVVKLENVSKFFKLYNSPQDRLKEALNPFGKRYHKEFYALKNISFELRQGECLGIIGKNGMGKSTLLKIIANVIQASSGSVLVNGTVSALLELGTGFNPEFSGRQNIYFYGTILGFQRNQVEAKIKEIIEFADIGEFIDQPVKTYSSGMFVRLAFSVQTSLEPDILIVDEVLSVGDIFFQQKCHSRIEKMLSKGTSLVIVSHDMQLVEKYSKEIIVLSNGELLFIGNPHKAIHKYYSLDNNYRHVEPSTDVGINREDNLIQSGDAFNLIDSWPEQENMVDPGKVEMYGDKNLAVLKKVTVCNSGGEISSDFLVGERINVFYEFQMLGDIQIPIGAVVFNNSLNIVIHGKDTLQYSKSSAELIDKVEAGRIIRFKQHFILNISPGEYTFAIGLATIRKEDLEKVNKVDFEKRDLMIKQILRIPQAGRIFIRPDSRNIMLPFHGYADLGGDYQIMVYPKGVNA
ncbi:MAG: ABC transporter ATP-binding protein [Ignavibacteriales bacterium]|nr:ABC transporter ATP-binding protein [Ignavibacteriales bacterium]